MENNLELWNKVEKTNPKYTKNAKVGGRDITAISPQYQIMQVTEQFGVYGRTWGFKNITLSYDLVDKLNLVVFKGTFFFPNGEFEIINSCKLYMDRALTMVDDNFAKKIETDALTKAISKLGFNADIFMGKFDDVRYVEEMKNEFGNENKPIQKPNTNTSTQVNHDLKWLNIFDKDKNFTKEWNALLIAISEKRIKSVEEVKKYYKVSKDIQTKIEEQLNK